MAARNPRTYPEFRAAPQTDAAWIRHVSTLKYAESAEIMPPSGQSRICMVHQRFILESRLCGLSSPAFFTLSPFCANVPPSHRAQGSHTPRLAWVVRKSLNISQTPLGRSRPSVMTVVEHWMRRGNSLRHRCPFRAGGRPRRRPGLSFAKSKKY